MGGRGSKGGGLTSGGGGTTTTTFNKGGGTNTGGIGGGGGGGGGGAGGNKGGGGAGTGGIQTGGGNGSGGGAGGGSTIEKQILPPDADLTAIFEESDIFDELITKYPGDREYKRNYSIFYNRWLESVELEEQIDSGITSDPIEAQFGSNITQPRQVEIESLISRMPERHRKLLNHRGVEIFVDDRADTSPGWDDYAQSEGITSSSTVGDGRELGDLSFYHKGKVFVSDASSHGSANVYVHELAHALDYNYFGLFSERKTFEKEWPPGSGVIRSFRNLSNDPEFVALHNSRIYNNTSIRAYYRKGSTGNKEDGRAESFAEGYAEYVTNGREGLKNLFKTYVTADQFIAILKSQGVID